MENKFFESIKKRRSYYNIGDKKVISDKQIKKLIETAVKYTPSALNSQTARLLVLLGKEHKKVWDLTLETLKKMVPENGFSKTEEKINSFKNGYGTVLFFEDIKVVEQLQKKYALYRDNFLTWSNQSSGMLQFVIWSVLENEGFGASLQHYNPLIDDDIKKIWNVPNEWKLISQLVFGSINEKPIEKIFKFKSEDIIYFK